MLCVAIACYTSCWDCPEPKTHFEVPDAPDSNLLACAGYLAHGTATDYFYEKLGVPLSFTWEIYGDSTAHFNDCFRMFNPLDKEKFEEVRHPEQGLTAGRTPHVCARDWTALSHMRGHPRDPALQIWQLLLTIIALACPR